MDDGQKVVVKRGYNYQADLKAIGVLFSKLQSPPPVKTKTTVQLDPAGYEWYRTNDPEVFVKLPQYVTLVDLLHKDSATVQAVYRVYKKAGDAEAPRGYLGASIIGEPCLRKLWYTFRGLCEPEFCGRMYRLFDTGHREEPRICADLHRIGCIVDQFDNQGEQFGVAWFGGLFAGHLDGIIRSGLPEAPKSEHVLECKTHNTKSFNKLKKEGVEKAHPKHFAQMQIYMEGTGIKRALYYAVCKETDELYTERIKHDPKVVRLLLDKAEMVIYGSLPPRMSERPDHYGCRLCDARTRCWNTINHAASTISD